MTAKALFFDVFGTVVDWRRGVAREVNIKRDTASVPIPKFASSEPPH